MRFVIAETCVVPAALAGGADQADEPCEQRYPA
jgi:hypothetical protein